jgi:hypothetical protein
MPQPANGIVRDKDGRTFLQPQSEENGGAMRLRDWLAACGVLVAALDVVPAPGRQPNSAHVERDRHRSTDALNLSCRRPTSASVDDSENSARAGRDVLRQTGSGNGHLTIVR